MSAVTRERSIVATTDQSQSGVAGRYARALFDLATENKAVADVAKALASFQGLVDESTDLQRLMRSPVFKTEDQTAAVEALAKKAGINGLALNFLKVMGGNRRLAAVPGAISALSVARVVGRPPLRPPPDRTSPSTPRSIRPSSAASS